MNTMLLEPDMKAEVLHGDAATVLRTMAADHFHVCVTSPPYWNQREYLAKDHRDKPLELGNESAPDCLGWATGHECGKCYVCHTVAWARELRRVLRPDGLFWLNIGDKAAMTGSGGNPAESPYRKQATTRGSLVAPCKATGFKAGEIIGMPWRVALALQADGWWLLRENIWHKPAPMPSSVNGLRFERHRVTIVKYEKIHDDARAKTTRHRVRSGVSENLRVPKSESALPCEPEGQNNSALIHIEAGNEEKEARIRKVGSGSSLAVPLCPFGKRPTECCAAATCLGENREGESLSQTCGCETGTDGTPAHPESQVREALLAVTEGKGQLGKARSKAARVVERDREAVGSLRMATNCGGSQKPLPLVQEQGSSPDDRPCDSAVERRSPRSEQYRCGLSLLQLQEARQNPDALIDCPGCPICAPNDGLVLRYGSWKTTLAHEQVFMFSKSARYFADREAVADIAIKGRAGSRFDSPRDIAVKHNQGVDRGGETGKANLRSVWRIPSEPLSLGHFAAFPTALPERCIVASTSSKGVCPTCGKNWARIVRTDRVEHSGKSESAYKEGTTANRMALMRQAARDNGTEVVSETHTLGWRVTCKCGGEPVPARVLDPFCGSGSTGVAAVRLGRDFTGIDLNAEYVTMARSRIAEAQGPLFTHSGKG
jgi:DNA modification methylase